MNRIVFILFILFILSKQKTLEQGFIPKQELNTLIAVVAKDARFYAPIEGDNGIEYVETIGDQPIAFNYVNVKLSPKGLFFPQREVLCRFCGDTLRDVPVPDDTFIVFGGRPCDARALSYLDRIFEDQSSQFADPYYVTRRKHALIITLACNEAAATCFCTTVGGNPTESVGSDILVFELDNELLFEAWTEKGKTFMATYHGFFQNPTDAVRSAKAEHVQKAVARVNAFAIEGIKARLDKIFEEAVWETITNTCLGCGACTYLCPTCHCFDITDETNPRQEGIRLRTWDSCQYPLFTKHASGHNPRVNKKQRMRQRIMHKFSYTVEKSDAIFCVGCGRCVLNCPINLDIREMLQTLYQL
jgi:sulfhydrogenase subunit beta (sulfur reductase)